MKSAFSEYADSINMSEALRKRVRDICESYKLVYPSDIRDVFVSEYIQEDGTRVYESLWLFSEQYAMEARDFLTKDDVDIAGIKNRVLYCRIAKEEYDFKEATDKSRLYVEVGISGRGSTFVPVTCEFKATEQNCKHLKAIIDKYIIANLTE